MYMAKITLENRLRRIWPMTFISLALHVRKNKLIRLGFAKLNRWLGIIESLILYAHHSHVNIKKEEKLFSFCFNSQS